MAGGFGYAGRRLGLLADRVRAIEVVLADAYGPLFDRLMRAKRRHDPAGVFDGPVRTGFAPA